tara:strand:- start:2749 stop:2985 length:237 start_codon:yes stop_codon:yes gene_type:complete
MHQSLTIKDKKYIILEKDILSEYRKIYSLEDENKIKYRLLIEDYRNASFMYEKFHVAYINIRSNGSLKTIKIEDIKIE